MAQVLSQEVLFPSSQESNTQRSDSLTTDPTAKVSIHSRDRFLLAQILINTWFKLLLILILPLKALRMWSILHMITLHHHLIRIASSRSLQSLQRSMVSKSWLLFAQLSTNYTGLKIITLLLRSEMRLSRKLFNSMTSLLSWILTLFSAEILTSFTTWLSALTKVR